MPKQRAQSARNVDASNKNDKATPVGTVSAKPTGLEALADKYRKLAHERPMDVKEVAERLGVSDKAVYKKQRDIGGRFKFGARVKFERSRFEEWWKAHLSGSAR